MDDDGVGADEERARVRDVERQLQRSLGTWVGLSTVGGSVALVVGRLRRRPALRAFGLQSLAWAAVDAAVLAASARGDTPAASRLRTLLLANTAADVAYVTAGAALAARPDRLPRRLRAPRTSDAALRGHGVAVVLQGLALLVVDLTAVARLRPPSPRPPPARDLDPAAITHLSAGVGRLSAGGQDDVRFRALTRH